MLFTALMRQFKLDFAASRRRPKSRQAAPACKLRVEALEQRCLLSYVVTDLGTLPGYEASHASDINAAGDVVGYTAGMSEVTQILSAIDQGDPRAAEQLLPLVYDELRKLAAAKLANEKPGQTLQATALVHEAYLRLVGNQRFGDQEPGIKSGDGATPASDDSWDSRGHFFAAAAEAMRRILINRARDKGRQKRGGSLQRVDLDAIEIALDTPAEDLLALDEALQELAGTDKLCADLVQLRFFAGLTLGEAAEALGMPRRTADRHWAYARAWLFDRLTGQE